MINSTQQQCRTALAQLLELQIEKIRAIDHYLREIKDRIAENDTLALNQLLIKQNLPINDIESFEKQRHKLLKDHGFEMNKTGVEQFIRWCDSNNRLRQLYETFTQAVFELQHAIQVNGLLVNKGQDRIRRSLQLLTGQGSMDAPKTYSSKGLTQAYSNKRSITLA